MERREFGKSFCKKLEAVSPGLGGQALAVFEWFQVHYSADIGEIIELALEKGKAAETVAALEAYIPITRNFQPAFGTEAFKKTPGHRQVREFFKSEIYLELLGVSFETQPA